MPREMETPEERAEQNGLLCGLSDVPRTDNPYATFIDGLRPDGALARQARRLADAWWRGWDRARAARARPGHGRRA
jgi:hypothetical protein